jgi:hypothetical protein
MSRWHRQFAEKDRSKIKDDRLRIKAKLLMKRPLPGFNFGRRRTWTEMALLANEIGKQKGYVPVRNWRAHPAASCATRLQDPNRTSFLPARAGARIDTFIIDFLQHLRSPHAPRQAGWLAS